ncbi:MAG: EAL domain-containing protein [Betaproteobacteria bacterium]|nr:EAL domain-containing protein [Betaproteobacteria bacterium]MCL2885833.1 EAL domain-containing protein [Betaproteobacteria bacterium]
MSALPEISRPLALVPEIPETWRLLIVDDEARLRQAYREFLAAPGRCIEECASGRDTLLRLERNDIDVLVLDLHLPDINGLEIMEWLTRNHITTSVIVFSATDSIDSAILALRQGAFEFIRKHGDPDELIQSVDRALRLRRMEQEHARMTALLEQSENMHRFLVEQSPDLIYTLDSDGRFVFINNRVESLLGFTREELLGQHYSVIIHEDDIEHARYAFGERRIGERATSNFEIRLRDKHNVAHNFDNRLIVVILSSQGIYDHGQSDAKPNFIGTSGIARDITERKRAEETIAFQAFHDLLTGLPNRTLFLDRLELSITQANRRTQRLGVMFLDIDRFKLINDTYGHQEGDRLLKEFANRIRHCLRSGDTLARHGGDEFTVLLPDISSANDASIIARKMLNSLKRPFTIAEREFTATVSIGIAVYPDDGKTPGELIHNADIAMYQIKGQGKDGFLQFHPTMNLQHVERISLENDLRQAINKGGQFTLDFQPQIDLRQQRITGVEALVRWQHPTQGLISPETFIPLAEETGLIVAISNWVLDAACRQLARLRRNGHGALRMGVNLSAREFERDDLLERIASPLRRHGVPPNLLEIEITESLLMKDAESIIAKTRQLRHSNVGISIDDFGTRYSSLNYLRRFSVSTIKIDQVFVRDIGLGSDAIIQAIIGIARSFDLRVQAEGIENKIQRDTLLGLGCDEMQGYLFSRPLSAEQLEEFLARSV